MSIPISSSQSQHQEAILSLDDLDLSPQLTSSHPNASASSKSSSTLLLIAKNGATHVISKQAAIMSELLRSMMESDSEAYEVPLTPLDSDILKKCIEYCTYHSTRPPRAIERPLPSSDMSDFVERWDLDFLQPFDDETVFRLMLTANYLSIQPLLSLCCARIAVNIKHSTPDQIRTMLGIRHDATSEEEEWVRNQFKDILA